MKFQTILVNMLVLILTSPAMANQIRGPRPARALNFANPAIHPQSSDFIEPHEFPGRIGVFGGRMDLAASHYEAGIRTQFRKSEILPPLGRFQRFEYNRPVEYFPVRTAYPTEAHIPERMGYRNTPTSTWQEAPRFSFSK